MKSDDGIPEGYVQGAAGVVRCSESFFAGEEGLGGRESEGNVWSVLGSSVYDRCIMQEL